MIKHVGFKGYSNVLHHIELKYNNVYFSKINNRITYI